MYPLICYCDVYVYLNMQYQNIRQQCKKPLNRFPVMQKDSQFNNISNTKPLQQQPALDLSSIDDNEHNSQNDDDGLSDDDINIEEMGLGKLELNQHEQHEYDDHDDHDYNDKRDVQDYQDFRNNVRELLLTQKIGNMQDNHHDQHNGNSANSQSQFQGEPLKGSFLRDMEILGKTISFQSTCYNIYEGNCQNSQILAQITEQSDRTSKNLAIFHMGFCNISKNSLQIQSKYVIDFSKIKKHPKSTVKKSRKPSQSSIKYKKTLTDAQASTKSMKNVKNRPQSQKKQIKNKSCRASPKYNQQQRRQSDLSNFSKQQQYSTLTKLKGSPQRLKKVGVNSALSEILKTKHSQISCIQQRDQVRKKIEQRINVNTNIKSNTNANNMTGIKKKK